MSLFLVGLPTYLIGCRLYPSSLSHIIFIYLSIFIVSYIHVYSSLRSLVKDYESFISTMIVRKKITPFSVLDVFYFFLNPSYYLPVMILIVSLLLNIFRGCCISSSLDIITSETLGSVLVFVEFSFYYIVVVLEVLSVVFVLAYFEFLYELVLLLLSFFTPCHFSVL